MTRLFTLFLAAALVGSGLSAPAAQNPRDLDDGELPTGFPSDFPTGFPSDLPTGFPSGFPTGFPGGFSGFPSGFPSGKAHYYHLTGGSRVENRLD